MSSEEVSLCPRVLLNIPYISLTPLSIVDTRSCGSTDILNHNFLTCAKAEIWALTVCIVAIGEKCQSHAMTLTLIGQCPMSNSSELFSYTTICSSFKSIEPLFLSYHVHRQTDRHTDGDKYSIVVVDKPQL